jgi:hypothetical protein
MRTKPVGGRHASACSCRLAIASPSRCRWTGRGDRSWMRPSIQRSTEQTRVVPAAPTVTVDAPSRAATGSGTARSVSLRRACTQASSERIAATESTPRPCRCGRCSLTRCLPWAPSCRNVVFSPWATNVSRPCAIGYRRSAARATWRSRANSARRVSTYPLWPGETPRTTGDEPDTAATTGRRLSTRHAATVRQNDRKHRDVKRPAGGVVTHPDARAGQAETGDAA